MRSLVGIMVAVLLASAGCEQPATTIVYTYQNPPAPSVTDVYVFGADWCQPCHRNQPEVDRIRREYSRWHRWHHYDVDRHPDIAAQFHVGQVPCYIVVDGGRERYRTHDPRKLRRCIGDGRR